MATVTISSPSNPSLTPDDVALKLHHNKDAVGFINPWPSNSQPSFWTIMKWIFWGKLTGQRKDPDTTSQIVPVHQPAFLPTRATSSLRATWLGHACTYAEFPGGLRVLFDPVFTERCSPFSFLGPKRYTRAPCKIADIPFIDAVVISHNHYDHLSLPTLLEVREAHPNVQFFVPLGNKPWFENEGFENVTELDWWEERVVTFESGGKDGKIEARISCLPCQHNSARGTFDRAHTLWASWSVESGDKKLWFGGDTGYRNVPNLPAEEFDYSDKYADLPRCPAFVEIGKLRGPFDLGLIPIGAYYPRSLLSSVHANPYDSVNIFVDVHCKRALGIHWGTWALTGEPILEPPKMLKEALKWKSLAETGLFDVCDVGESREF